MKKEVLLVLPRNERGYWGKVTNGKAGFVRLSLPTVAALTPSDWKVTIHDARAHPVDFDRDVGLVGITAFSAETPSAYEIADKFRAKGVPVVMGGVHATAMPDEALEHVDAVVIGEAEEVWETLLRDLEKGELKRKYKADQLCDMRNMKIPRRDLLDRDMYVSAFNTIQATRGCPFDCEYCSVTQVFGQEYRMRPVHHVIDEIRAFDTRDFMFIDDNICGKPSYAKELFRALTPLKKVWGAQTSITFARDEELLDLYAKAGGRYAFIGLESISEDNLAQMNKKWNRSDGFAYAIDRIHAAGINILGSFIVGLDGDDHTVFKRMLEFIDKHKIDAAEFHVLTPLPGTRLAAAMDADGRIIDRDWARYTACETVFQPKQMTPEELDRGFYSMWHEMYTFPKIIKRSFRSFRGIPMRLGMNISYRNKGKRMPRD
jgi:radical SAM superfamily enzyme YgiQ (UPF0313 family)